MKKTLSVLLLLALLASCLACWPVMAEEEAGDDGEADPTVQYTAPALTEGGPEQELTLQNGFTEEIGEGEENRDWATVTANKTGPTTLKCRSNYVMRVNGQELYEKSYPISDAGTYLVEVWRESVPENIFRFKVEVLPDITIQNNTIYTTYPTVTCTNVVSMTLSDVVPAEGGQAVAQNPRAIASGEVIKTFGKYMLEVIGKNYNPLTGTTVEETVALYHFGLQYCDITPISFNEELGKYAMTLTVGSFDDIDVKVTLDGEELAAGSVKVITRVGDHVLGVLQGGEAVTAPFTRPTAEEMQLYFVPQWEADGETPIDFDFSRWDADFFIDGKSIPAVYTMNKHGEHVLRVEGANGYAKEYKVTFDNPNVKLAIVAAVPAALMLAAAVYFLMARRRIV